MRTPLILFVGAMASGSAFAQTAITLPANIVADRAVVAQYKSALDAAVKQLRTDRHAGNTNALPADETAVRLARMQLMASLGTLHRDAAVVLQPDRDRLYNAVAQLHTDQTTGSSSALSADQAAVSAAEAQLKTDRAAVFGGLGLGRGDGLGKRLRDRG